MMAPKLTDDGIDLSNDHMDIDDLREAHAVKAETSERIVFMDESNYDLAEFADDMDVSYDTLYQQMHELARETYHPDEPGDAWSVNDPIVIAKKE